jgi:hypothetical protein
MHKARVQNTKRNTKRSYTAEEKKKDETKRWDLISQANTSATSPFLTVPSHDDVTA